MSWDVLLRSKSKESCIGEPVCLFIAFDSTVARDPVDKYFIVYS